MLADTGTHLVGERVSAPPVALGHRGPARHAGLLEVLPALQLPGGVHLPEAGLEVLEVVVELQLSAGQSRNLGDLVPGVRRAG
jgi:hypothetical protein